MSSPPPDLEKVDANAPVPKGKRRRPWRKKLTDALRGMKLGIRGHSSFSVLFFFAALVLAAAFLLGCEFGEWCILILCIGMVLAAELFNSAIETLIRSLDEDTKERSWRVLDITAGAVLLASIAAAIVGIIIFVHRLQGWGS